MSEQRVQVVGIGTIGGSVAAGLRKRGWYVTGIDTDETRAAEAQRRGIVDAVGVDEQAAITVIATPLFAVAQTAHAALARGGIVTDVGSVKGSVVQAVDHPRFVGGHPMAGSERSGLDGVDPNLFAGATWVLTPTDLTDPGAYLQVRELVGQLGADVVITQAAEHDEMVATISHVPHLAATALMTMATDPSHASETVLRLAAGGFRDMTRIAAGKADLWADISFENRDAIVGGLDRLVVALAEMRMFLVGNDRDSLEAVLAKAAQARTELPRRAGRPADLRLLKVPIPDRPGVLGEVLGIFAELSVNVEDLEIAHSTEGDRGTLLLTVAAVHLHNVRRALTERSLSVAVEAL